MRYICIIAWFFWAMSSNAADQQLVVSLSREFPSATSYSQSTDDSGAVKDIYLFYDKDDTLLGGAAVRSIKTYSRVTGVLAVRKDDGVVKVVDVSFPDIRKIRKSSERRTVLKAAHRANGRVVLDKGSKKKLDAVTGATRYKRNLFLNLNKMASILVDHMEKTNSSKKINLPEER